MRQHGYIGSFAIVMALFLAPVRASAQAMLADDIIILSKGQREQEKARTNSHLGSLPGAGERLFRQNPGGGEPRLGEQLGGGAFRTSMQAKDVLSAASSEGRNVGQARATRILPPAILAARATPIYGPLEVPESYDEGPPNGLTLDMTIDRLSQVNYGLRTKFQEIPKAQADILSAGLRANPLVFASADGVPYGNYSPRRPGENSYSVVLIQPIDVNRKRLVRVHVAEQARKVLEAQYQDAVRLEIDNLYTAFVDVLDARETVRYASASREGLNRVLKTTEEQYRKDLIPQTEVESAAIQRDSAEVFLEQAETALRQSKRALAVLLDILPAQVDSLEIRGSIRDDWAPHLLRRRTWPSSPSASGPISSPTGSASAAPRQTFRFRESSGSPMSSSSTLPTASGTTPPWTRRVPHPGASVPSSASPSSTRTRGTSAGPNTTSYRRKSNSRASSDKPSPTSSERPSIMLRPGPRRTGSNGGFSRGQEDSGT